MTFTNYTSFINYISFINYTIAIINFLNSIAFTGRSQFISYKTTCGSNNIDK